MNKIGIMGGTFNPIHNGHITLALEGYKQFGLSKVLMMVSPTPPHKTDINIISAMHRANMVKLAIDDYPGELEFSDFELNRSGYIYTADTLTLLKNDNPDTEYYFILGGDSLKNIEKWYKPEVVLSNAVILAAIRDDMNVDDINKQILHLSEKYKCDIRLLNTPYMPISSSNIRNAIKNQTSIDEIENFVPKPVAHYIKENNLYKY